MTINLPFVKEYGKAQLCIKAFLVFAIGLFLSPLSYSLFWFLFFLIVFEILLATRAGYDFRTRIVLIMASVAGYVLGRLLVHMEIN